MLEKIVIFYFMPSRPCALEENLGKTMIAGTEWWFKQAFE